MPELIWDGKFDATGRKVAPPRVVLPFQTVETVNESAQERQRTLDFFASERPAEWRNRLIWGDKKYVLPSLAAEFSGAIDLIYIDPPFATGADFSLPIKLEASSFTKEPSVIEQKAYRDTWGVSNEDRRRGVTPYDRYVRWIYDTVTVLRDLLTEQGSIYVHIGPNVNHFVRSCLDEIFGVANFRAEIIWKRTSAHSDVGQGARHLGRVHDSILLYTASDQFVWHQPHAQHDEKYVKSHYPYVEQGTGRRYGLWDITGPGGAAKGNPYYEIFGITKYWRYSQVNMARKIAEGRVIQPSPGAIPREIKYLDESQGTAIGSLWTDINPINSQAIEDSGYPTQKPEALLQRILEMSSDPKPARPGLLLRLGHDRCRRREARAALDQLRPRPLRRPHDPQAAARPSPTFEPFVVQNLGKYERQLWQTAEFGESATARTAAYRGFILDLYHATPIAGYAWLHGLKQGRMVHVGTVDAPVTVGDVKQIVAEFRKAVGTGKDAPKEQSVDILGWDFAFELNEIARQDAERAGIDLRLVRIPREVLDKRAVEQGDIRFFELAALVGRA